MKKLFYKLKLNENGIPFLAEEGRSYDIDCRCKYTDSADRIFALARALDCTEDAEESVYMLCMNLRCKPIAVFQLSSGSDNASFVNPKMVYERALMCGAAGFVLWHNHPSGNLQPSGEDLNITGQLVRAGKLLQIECFDHLIVSRNDYVSLRDMNPELFKN